MTQKLIDVATLRNIIDNLPTSIFVKDENLRFVLSNQAHCELIGKTEGELLGKSDADFYPEAEASVFGTHDRSVIESGNAHVCEELAKIANGMTLPVVTRKARLTTPDGRVFLIGTNSDFSAIRRRENQYKALTETVPVGVAQIDENLEITFANPLFNAFCGGDGSEMDQARLLTKLRAIHPEFPGATSKFEAVVQGLGNQPRNVIVISSGWLELGDDIRSATVSLVDISQMAELQRINEDVVRLNKELAANVKKLAEAQDELVKKGRMEQLGQLTATVAHELRNPLGAVRTSAFLLERKLKDKNMGVEMQIDRINKGIVRCDNIISQLLDFSRSKQLQCQPEDLDSWLTGVVEEEARKLPRDVEVEVLLGLGERKVPFDPSRLQRAVINMISNAVEAMVVSGEQRNTAKGEPPRLTISTFYKQAHVSLRVSDNGPGIAADVLSRIREPLFTTKSFGTGLGIPAIEQIAVQHGGRLDIVSEVGMGTTFTVWLPLPLAEQAKQVA
jgi:PAS domain S-box-containing protein